MLRNSSFGTRRLNLGGGGGGGKNEILIMVGLGTGLLGLAAWVLYRIAMPHLIARIAA